MVSTGAKGTLRGIAWLMAVSFFCVGPAASDQACPPASHAGWEQGGAYDCNYVVSEFDEFKGTFVKAIDITPMPGMAPGVGIIVKDRDGDMVTVHLGPQGFVDPKGLGLSRDMPVKVKGVWAEIDGKEFFMASKVKKGEYSEIKLRRTRDGKPFWAMTEEELAKERGD